MADFVVRAHGRQAIVLAENATARAYLDDHHADEAGYDEDGAIVIEHRALSPLVEGLREEGFEVDGHGVGVIL